MRKMSAKEVLTDMFAEGVANDELRHTDLEAYKAKMEVMMPVNTCCFCRETFRGFGNNPQPLLDEGIACDVCNRSIVVFARIQATRAPKS